MRGQGIFADSHGFALKASVNIDVRRDFLGIPRGFKIAMALRSAQRHGFSAISTSDSSHHVLTLHPKLGSGTVELYRLTHRPRRSLRPRYNIAPTTTIDMVRLADASREPDALGSHSELVEKDGQGSALDLQRASRNSSRRLLRMARGGGNRAPICDAFLQTRYNN